MYHQRMVIHPRYVGDRLVTDSMSKRFAGGMFVSPAKRFDIESVTRGQSVVNEMASSMWMVERRK